MAASFPTTQRTNGFRKGYSTVDHTHVEYTKPLRMAVIDCEKVFDSVHTTAVLEALKYEEIEKTCTRILGNITG